FHVGTPSVTFDLRKVELTPLEQRKLTFDSHAMVLELEKSGLEKRQAELIVSALVTLTTANMDIVYKDMVTKSHQVGQQRLSESLLISRLLQMNRSCFLLARF
ncbi:Coiled-coil domain-containing protein 90B, mitochondrial, partial [Xenotaenia resolanae]